MWPSLLDIPTASGDAAIGTYGLMIVVGLAVAFAVFHGQVRGRGVDVGQAVGLYAAASLGGLAGARVLYVITVGGAEALLGCTGGFAFYGGVIGGFLAALGLVRALKLPVWVVADAAAPAVIVGHAIGRLGCFFAGCCHGAPVAHPEGATPLLADGTLKGQIWLHDHAPWLSTSFEGGASRILDTPLYPTQLWLSAGSFVVFGVLMAVAASRRFDGQIAGLALVLEPPVRAAVEAFRADQRGYVVSWVSSGNWLPEGMRQAGTQTDGTVVGITTSQGIAGVLVCVGLAILALRRGGEVTVASEDPLVDATFDPLAPE